MEHKQTRPTGQEQENKGRSTPPLTPEQDDRELIETILIPLWEQWQDELIESGDAGQREKDFYTKVFCEYSGATEKAPFTLMFLAFCGGVDSGLKLISLMENDKPERSLHDDRQTF